MDSSILDTLKKLLREEAVPYFSDEELEFYYNREEKDVNSTVYACLCIKAEDTTLSLSGLSLADTSKYFHKLAQRYRPRNTGILKG